MAEQSLNIEVDEEGGVTTVHLEGSVGAIGAEQLKTTLTPLCERSGARIVLDCTRLDYMSSPCMSQIVMYDKTCAAHGGGFALYGLNERILHVFRLIRTDEVLTLCGSREEALEAMS